MADAGPIRVLFVCTENAARSQMTEAILRARGGDAFEVFSAGSDPGRLHGVVVAVMAEVGIDISGQLAESVDAYRAMALDYVITLCRETRELSPSIRAKELVIHQPFEDPAVAPEAEQRERSGGCATPSPTGSSACSPARRPVPTRNGRSPEGFVRCMRALCNATSRNKHARCRLQALRTESGLRPVPIAPRPSGGIGRRA